MGPGLWGWGWQALLAECAGVAILPEYVAPDGERRRPDTNPRLQAAKVRGVAQIAAWGFPGVNGATAGTLSCLSSTQRPQAQDTRSETWTGTKHATGCVRSPPQARWGWH
jgi:hypothetical protein